MNKHRLGKFTITQNELCKWEDWLPVMGNFVVVEARYRYDLGAIEYLAFSPLFDEIDGAVVAPTYELTVTCDGFSPATIKAVRTDGTTTKVSP
jgi:hypothetical protein